MKVGDQIRTVATSATPEEIAAGTETTFFTRYDTAPEELYRSFADGRVRFDEYSDSFGRFRSIYMPVTAADGRVHVIGADIDLARLDQRLHDALVKSIAIGIAPFTLSMARSEEHTSELQSLMRISYAVFCLQKQYTS